MANIESGKGSKSTNFELNLVPFIDLMSVMITFLLITAVWTQVSMIQIGSSIYGKKSSDQTPEPPPQAEIPFRLDIKSTGYRVIYGSQQILVPKIGDEFDLLTLKARLEQIKSSNPAKEDAVITMEDSMVYNELIRGMDALLQSGFPSISVATGGAQ